MTQSGHSEIYGNKQFCRTLKATAICFTTKDQPGLEDEAPRKDQQHDYRHNEKR